MARVQVHARLSRLDNIYFNKTNERYLALLESFSARWVKVIFMSVLLSYPFRRNDYERTSILMAVKIFIRIKIIYIATNTFITYILRLYER